MTDSRDWCVHSFVDLRTWQWPDCDHAVPDGTRERLGRQPTRAPKGALWVLTSKAQDWTSGGADGEEVDWAGGVVDGLYVDRAYIARSLIRDRIFDVKTVRAWIARIHWYQGFYNPDLFEGWEEDRDGARSYRLALEKIYGWTPG